MQLTLNKQSALRIIRSQRCSHPLRALRIPTRGIATPSHEPAKRWSGSLIDLSPYGIPPFSRSQPLHVAVPRKQDRLRIANVKNTIMSHGLPPTCVIALDDDLSMSCPELVFLEMAQEMSPALHLMLGLELCGRFSRDPLDPRNGPITYKVQQACTVESIRRFLASCSDVVGLTAARTTAALLMDNAWSSTESVIAAFMRLPITELGYGFGNLSLNARIDIEHGYKATRVPDIVIAGTNVGLNFDGKDHLDLDALIQAAKDVGANPHNSETQRVLDDCRQQIRDKYVDDRRRDRELMAEGYQVFSVTKEDLFAEGGLDQLMMQVMDAVELAGGAIQPYQRGAILNKSVARARQRLIWALLPGTRGRELLQRDRMLAWEPTMIVEEIVPFL